MDEIEKNVPNDTTDDIDELIEVPEIEEPELSEIENSKEEQTPKKEMSSYQKQLEELYSDFETLKADAAQKQKRAKEIKDEIIVLMEEHGTDYEVINGLDSLVEIDISYVEREVLNKKNLAKTLGVTQKELSKPEIIIELTKDGRISTDMIQAHIELEERMQFSAREYNPGDDN